MASKTEKATDLTSTSDVAELQELYHLMLDQGLDILELKDDEGRMLGDAIPVVSIVKDGSYSTLDFGDDPSSIGG